MVLFQGTDESNRKKGYWKLSYRKRKMDKNLRDIMQ